MALNHMIWKSFSQPQCYPFEKSENVITPKKKNIERKAKLY